MAQLLILDTNVLSELMKQQPSAAVRAWLEKQPQASICTTSITLAEIELGIALLPQGKRKAALEMLARDVFAMLPPCLPFDAAAANLYGNFAAKRQRAGLHVDPLDLQIAAIAASREAVLVTRNTGDFEGLGLPLINPWKEKA
jgi:predicted nucleic acid-binding protein